VCCEGTERDAAWLERRVARVDREAFGPYREIAKECIRLEWAVRRHLPLPDDVRELWLAALGPSWDKVIHEREINHFRSAIERYERYQLNPHLGLRFRVVRSVREPEVPRANDSDAL
jgi:hypothetical protein